MDNKRTGCLECYVIISIIIPAHVLAENIALGKPATQLGTYDYGGPELAVDGNTDQDRPGGSCAFPDSWDGFLDDNVRGQPVWWSVDLAAGNSSRRFVVQNVTIYFRFDCCEERRRNVLVLIGTTNDTKTQLQCGRTTNNASIQTVDCISDVPIRYLTIRQQYLQLLELCEIIVWGYEYQACALGWWGKDCLTKCNCFEDVCNDITGKCKVSGVTSSEVSPVTVTSPSAVTSIFISELSPCTDTSPSGKGSDTAKVGPGLVAIISGVFAAVILFIILATISTFFVTRSKAGEPVQLGCRTCIYVKMKRSSAKRDTSHGSDVGYDSMSKEEKFNDIMGSSNKFVIKALVKFAFQQRMAGPDSGEMNEMRNISSNYEEPISQDSRNPNYEELNDTFYQDIGPCYTNLKPNNNKDNNNKYVNIQRNDV